MNRAAIVSALRQVVVDAALADPVAYPNVANDGAVPRVELAWADPDRQGVTLAEGATLERGRLILTAVGTVGGGEDATNARADALAALYPANTVIAATGARIVLGAPIVSAGYRDGPEWRVPVRVPYTAFSQT